MALELDLLYELRQQVVSLSHTKLNKKAFIGFDGFVDNLKKAVKERQNYSTVYFKTIQEFTQRLSKAIGKSGQVEMVCERIKTGGNAPILANTLALLGIENYCVGSMGYPNLHPVFQTLHKDCHPISVLEPGKSDALEFEDGKLIFSELSVFDVYDWKFIRDTIGIEKIQQMVAGSNLLAFVDWANLQHASDIWDGLLHDAIKPSGRKDFYFLFDLCDPSKKTCTQIDEVLDLISSFSPYGKVTLGLNENETLKIWCALHGVDFANPMEKEKIPMVNVAGEMLYKSMNIDCLLVHPVDRTIVYRPYQTIELMGRYITQPKVLTGGGDNLNAGYCLGLLSELSIEYCMLLGMAASGAYIDSGKNPDMNDLLKYLDVWIYDLEQVKESKPVHEFMHRHE